MSLRRARCPRRRRSPVCGDRKRPKGDTASGCPSGRRPSACNQPWLLSKRGSVKGARVTGVCPLAAHLEGVLRNGRSLWLLMPVSKGSWITGPRGCTFWRPRCGPARRSRSGPRRPGARSRARDIVAPKDRAREAVPLRSLAARSRRSRQSNSTQRPRFKWVTPRWALSPSRADCGAHGAICRTSTGGPVGRMLSNAIPFWSAPGRPTSYGTRRGAGRAGRRRRSPTRTPTGVNSEGGAIAGPRSTPDDYVRAETGIAVLRFEAVRFRGNRKRQQS